MNVNECVWYVWYMYIVLYSVQAETLDRVGRVPGVSEPKRGKYIECPCDACDALAFTHDNDDADARAQYLCAHECMSSAQHT